MAPTIKTVLIAILAIAIGLYKVYLHDALMFLFGVGRVIQPLEDFPQYRCHRIQHPLLESCEDIWLDERARKLYAACSGVAARTAWNPGGNHYDLAARAAAGGGTDHLAVLDIDQPGADGLYGVRAVPFRGQNGEPHELDLHGFDVRAIDNGRRLRFWLINHRPPLDASGEPVQDATKTGANSTIEVYDLDVSRRGRDGHLVHVKTIASDSIVSPNNLVVVDDDEDRGAFLFTNDHSDKVGALRGLAPILGGGSIGYCRTDTGQCHLVATEKFKVPNGITRDPVSGLIYVAQSVSGAVTVHRLTDDGRLLQIDQVPLSIGPDNLSADSDGNVFVAGFPDVLQLLKAFEDPHGTGAPSTVLMIRKKEVGGEEQAAKVEHEVIKLVEDAEAKVLPTTTTAVNDLVSGRLFLGAVASTFIGVCEKQ
ncbi:predicted protein [Aspergillus terreus NIH2624]|uniref:SMP-30/Gluconolactonase/LRE-like region domain-containing protein n=1 Tax=Aspergillus terreus (strain NIH 2624 / FGSC A1156) TaxID=341663 RepID=Q0CGU8_ASPTN|nr:uncharacterized protein ATEG_07094 [Aspergillus terreus NIH2624]EAU32478.1 predicted protein [Aspergillus terreus NIH2624]